MRVHLFILYFFRLLLLLFLLGWGERERARKNSEINKKPSSVDYFVLSPLIPFDFVVVVSIFSTVSLSLFLVHLCILSSSSFIFLFFALSCGLNSLSFRSYITLAHSLRSVQIFTAANALLIFFDVVVRGSCVYSFHLSAIPCNALCRCWWFFLLLPFHSLLRVAFHLSRSIQLDFTLPTFARRCLYREKCSIFTRAEIEDTECLERH